MFNNISIVMDSKSENFCYCGIRPNLFKDTLYFQYNMKLFLSFLYLFNMTNKINQTKLNTSTVRLNWAMFMHWLSEFKTTSNISPTTQIQRPEVHKMINAQI